eukprot:COSAG05_NODE_21351_length_272_cov_0.901734_1_plen_32_part_01
MRAGLTRTIRSITTDVQCGLTGTVPLYEINHV